MHPPNFTISILSESTNFTMKSFKIPNFTIDSPIFHHADKKTVPSMSLFQASEAIQAFTDRAKDYPCGSP